MSVQAVAAVLQHSRARGSARAVLLVLAEHYNADDPGQGCWPCVARIAEKARLSERQTQRRLRQLNDMGEIRRSWPKGRRTPTYYITLSKSNGDHVTLRANTISGSEFLAPDVTLREAPFDASNPPRNHMGVSGMSPLGVGDVTLAVSPMSPLPYGDASDTRTGLDLEPEVEPEINRYTEVAANEVRSPMSESGENQDQGQKQVATGKHQEPTYKESVRLMLKAKQLEDTPYFQRVAASVD